VTCGLLVFGFTALFLRFATRRSGVMDSLTANAYGIYIVHYAFVTWLQFGFLGIDLPAVAKGTLVFVAALALSWSTVALLRRVPSVARVI
jgi:surface polysaccharide O-acyltransferase-like enzyme